MDGASCWAMPVTCPVRSAGKGSMLRSWTRPYSPGSSPLWLRPLGGKGINAAPMDAADIAWKLALVVRGAAKPSLLNSYAIERGAADHHALEVSDEIHRFVIELIAMCDGGRTPILPPADPVESVAILRKRSMLDV